MITVIIMRESSYSNFQKKENYWLFAQKLQNIPKLAILFRQVQSVRKFMLKIQWKSKSYKTFLTQKNCVNVPLKYFLMQKFLFGDKIIFAQQPKVNDWLSQLKKQWLF